MVRTWTDWDWAGAEQEWQRALELDPNAANAHAYYAHFLAIVGRTDEAIPHSERALELDPFNALFHGLYAVALHFDRRDDDAMAAARTALAMQPGQGVARYALQRVFIAKGMRDEQLDHQRERIAHDPKRVAAFEQGLAEAGYEGAQRGIADVLAARYEKSIRVGAGGIAFRYFDAGDYDRAIDWLEKAYEEHDPNLPYLGDPLYDPLRSDPRFQALLRRMNLPED
jgi:adenylate cyclase